MTEVNTREEVAVLRREVERLRDEMIKYRRTLEDLLLNLDTENMPAVSSLIESYRSDSSSAIAEVKAEADDAMAKISLVVATDEDGEHVRGEIIVEAINGASGVSIEADKINLNGAVTANENFKIDEEGKVECKAITVTGGEIHIPMLARSSEPVFSVYASDKNSAVKIYADKIMFETESSDITEYYAVSLMNHKRVTKEINQTFGDEGHYMQYRSENTSKSLTTYASEYDEYGDEIYDSLEYGYAEITPYQIRHTYITENPVTAAKAANMKPLYIDRLGRIYACEV